MSFARSGKERIQSISSFRADLPQLGRFPCAGHQKTPPRTGRGLAEDWPRTGHSSTKLPSTSRPGTTRTHTADSAENHELPCRKRCFSLVLFHAAGGHRRHQRPFDASRHVTMMMVKPAGHAVAGTQTPRALWTENQTSSALALNTKQLSQSKAARKATTVGAEDQQQTSKPSNRCVCVCGGFSRRN